MACLSLLAVVPLAAASCAESGRVIPAPSEKKTTARYLAIGDSFTIGTGSTPEHAFPARLVDRWRTRGCSAILENVAVNGYTTENIIATELPAVASFRPTIVTIAAGANDIAQGRSIDAYRVSIRTILDTVKATGARIVVLPQPDWSQSPSAAGIGHREVLAGAIKGFNAALAEEARAKGAEYADLTPLMTEQAASAQLASDGLHPSAMAYDAWAGELAKMLRSPCRD